MSTDKKTLRFLGKYSSNKVKKQPMLNERVTRKTEDDIDLHPDTPDEEVETQANPYQESMVSNEEIEATAMQSWYEEEATKQTEQEDDGLSENAISLGYNDAESYDELVENSLSELADFFS